VQVAIHGLGQGPSAEKIRCMSTQRWTLRSVKELAGAGRSYGAQRSMLETASSFSHRLAFREASCRIWAAMLGT
jgi:hypothetical protein